MEMCEINQILSIYWSSLFKQKTQIITNENLFKAYFKIHWFYHFWLWESSRAFNLLPHRRRLLWCMFAVCVIPIMYTHHTQPRAFLHSLWPPSFFFFPNGSGDSTLLSTDFMYTLDMVKCSFLKESLNFHITCVNCVIVGRAMREVPYKQSLLLLLLLESYKIQKYCY